MGLSPPVLARPHGPLALLGPRDGYLWLVNAHGQPQVYIQAYVLFL